MQNKQLFKPDQRLLVQGSNQQMALTLTPPVLYAGKKSTAPKRIWSILWERKGLVLGCIVVCGLTAFIASFFETPLYKAQTSLEIDDVNSHFLQVDELNPAAKESGNPEAYLSTQMDMLSSSALLARVVDRLHLEERYETKSGGPLEKWGEKLELNAASDSPKEAAIADARKNLTISKGQGASRIVSIEYSSTDPRLAAAFPNTLAHEFIERGIEMRMQAMRRVNGWLNKELEQSRERLQASEDALLEYNQASGFLFTDDQNSVAQTRLKEIQEELSKAQADRMAKEATYEMISKSSGNAMSEMTGDPTTQQYELKLTDLRRQLAEAEALMTPANYKVKQLKAQVDELEAAEKNAEKQTALRITNQYAAAERREGLVRAEYEKQEQLVSQQGGKASRYNFLKNDVETNRQLYKAMLERVKGLDVATAVRVSNVSIFDAAEIPSHPFRPKPVVNAAVGLVFGVVLGVMLAFVRDAWDSRLKAPDDISAYLNVPQLGAVPTLARKQLKRAEGSKAMLLNEAGEAVEEGVEHALLRQQVYRDFTYVDGVTQVAESFRNILASLLLNNESPNVIVITSPSPREGKTSTASNLAVALAGIGKEVLLIDGDFKKARLHEIFGVSNDEGFSDLLAYEEPRQRQSPFTFVQPTRIPRLSLLTAGLNRGAGADRFYGPEVGEILGKLRRNVDIVLIDTPPILPIPDARLISRSADGVILVCRAGVTDREMAKVAVERLRADGVHIYGTVLNDYHPKSSGQYEYYGSYLPKGVGASAGD